VVPGDIVYEHDHIAFVNKIVFKRKKDNVAIDITDRNPDKIYVYLIDATTWGGRLNTQNTQTVDSHKDAYKFIMRPIIGEVK
jgi:hypothetical protein